jgi:signal transduction histidine kinase
MYKRFEPRLYVQGLILVAVPLLFEVFFVSAILHWQGHHEQMVRAEARSTDIVMGTDFLWSEAAEHLLRTFFFHVFTNGQRPESKDDERELSRVFSDLKEMTGKDSATLSSLQDILNYSRELRAIENRLKPLAGLSDLEKLEGFKYNVETITEGGSTISKFAAVVRKLRQPEHFNETAAALEVKQSRAIVEAILWLGTAASVLLSAALFAFFLRSIYTGVKILHENTQLFKSAKELKPALIGSGDIARLDQAFHRMAEEITETEKMKQAFLSMISHDVRSPVMAIQGYLELVESESYGSLPEEIRNDAHRCFNLMNRLMETINDLLDLEKIEAGKMRIARRSIYAEVLFERAEHNLQEALLQTENRLNVIETDAELYVDLDAMTRVFTYLLSYAISTSQPHSPVKVAVNVLKNSCEIEISFAVDEIISEEVAIFDRFSDLVPAREFVNLELPLSKAFIELHGGKVRLDQNEEARTQAFRISLPYDNALDAPRDDERKLPVLVSSMPSSRISV